MANINLLPVEYKEKPKYNLKRVLAILLVVFLAFGTAYLYYYLELQIDYKERQLKIMKTELAIIDKVIVEVSNLKKDKAIIEERVKVIEDLIANQFHLSRTLGEFSAALLDEVWVDNLSLNANQTFDFTANTLNNYLIAKCMVAFKNYPTFDNIELGYVRKSKIIEENKDTEIVNFKLLGIFSGLISGWINSIALIGQSLPDNLEIGKSYNLSKETPLMPEYEPSDPIAALEKIRYIRSGGTIDIVSIKRDRDTPWYFVRVNSDSLIMKR